MCAKNAGDSELHHKSSLILDFYLLQLLEMKKWQIGKSFGW